MKCYRDRGNDKYLATARNELCLLAMLRSAHVKCLKHDKNKSHGFDLASRTFFATMRHLEIPFNLSSATNAFCIRRKLPAWTIDAYMRSAYCFYRMYRTIKVINAEIQYIFIFLNNSDKQNSIYIDYLFHFFQQWMLVIAASTILQLQL